MRDYENIKEDLLRCRIASSEISSSCNNGLYALFIADLEALPEIALSGSDLLYIGKTTSLATRNHFIKSNSGFSSPRRTIGALLKSKLSLSAIPRAPGVSKSNTTNYRFTEAGERDLTKWMCRNLTYNEITVEDNIDVYEQRLIRDLEPPLNLTNWRNPQRTHIKALRDICKIEARSISVRTGPVGGYA